MGLSFGTNDISEVDFGSTSIGEIWLGNTLLWSAAPSTPNYLFFTAKLANSTVSLGAVSATAFDTPKAYSYSTDGITWTDYTVSSNADTAPVITLTNIGDKVYFRGNNSSTSESGYRYSRFTVTGNVSVAGNINTLLDYTLSITTLLGWGFAGLFALTSSLTDASELLLPATILCERCYYSLFDHSGILSAPEILPALLCPPYAYLAMFAYCYNLLNPPKIMATLVKAYSMYFMFMQCESLTIIPKLYVNSVDGTYAMGYMFYYCRSLKMSTTLDSTYAYSWRIPDSGTGTIISGSALFANMFGTTAGSYTGAGALNTTYYTTNAPI